MMALVSGDLPKLNSSEKKDTKIASKFLQINECRIGTKERPLSIKKPSIGFV